MTYKLSESLESILLSCKRSRCADESFCFKRQLSSAFSQDVNANGLSKTAEIKLGLSHSRKCNLIIEWSWQLFKF